MMHSAQYVRMWYYGAYLKINFVFYDCFSFRNAIYKIFEYFKSSKKIKSSLYYRYFAEACNEWRGPFPLLSAWATQLRRNNATVASRWRHCADLTGLKIEPQTSRTDSVCFTTELTSRFFEYINYKNKSQ